MTVVSAALSGTFKIGGDTEINRLGYGAMRITGRGIWGPPEDEAEAFRTLQRLPELDVNFIDTADSYGPDISEVLIREALHPYDGLMIATKAGLTRSGPDHYFGYVEARRLKAAATVLRKRANAGPRTAQTNLGRLPRCSRGAVRCPSVAPFYDR